MNADQQKVDPAVARDFLLRKKKQRQAVLARHYEQALRDFEAIKSMIIECYHPSRIWQWGSLLDRAKFREYSDIDIAVEGIDEAEEFFKMFGDAERLTNFPLDLIDINKIAPEFAALIKSKGKIVYESGNSRITS